MRQPNPAKPREKYFERHRIPTNSCAMTLPGVDSSFVRQEPGFNPPDNDRNYFFLIFQKPENRSSR